MATMKSIDYSKPVSESSMDFGVIQALKEMALAIQKSAERPLTELRMPFPEIHNEYNVPSPQIDVHVPVMENKVVVEPTPVHVNVHTPDVTNHVRCDFPDLKKVVLSIYILSGVLGASAMGIITILLRH